MPFFVSKTIHYLQNSIKLPLPEIRIFNKKGA
jgi:hypothetical protein